MQTRTVFFVALTGLIGISANVRAQNDDCSTPQTIVGLGTFSFDNTTASTSPQQLHPFCPPLIGHDLWYLWFAPSTGNASLSTCGQVSFDSEIAVYPGSGCTASGTNWCDDDACGLESFVSFPVLAGNPYMLEIGGSSISNFGPGSFTLSITGPPSNDDCSTPIVLGTGGGANYDNSTATPGAQSGTPCGLVNNDIWYTWTASMTGTAEMDTCFQTNDDTSLAIYLGSGCPSGGSIACDDNNCGVQSMVTFPIVAGATYTVQVGSGSGNGGPSSFIIIETAGGGTSVGTPYCSGDGTGTACSCGNSGASGHGCASSLNASGAELAATGIAAISSDALVLQGTGMPPNGSVLYFQGTTQTSSGAGSVFGDGLRCASGSIVRLATRMNDATGASGYGGPLGDTPVSVRGQIPAGGGTRDYQAWYRNAAAFCTPSTFNLTNGLEIVWGP